MMFFTDIIWPSHIRVAMTSGHASQVFLAQAHALDAGLIAQNDELNDFFVMR